MDFSLTDEQERLAAAARRYLDAEPADEWATITRLGWMAGDLDAVAQAVVAEETGYALSPIPWLVTVGLAGPSLHAAGRAESLPGPTTLAWQEPGVHSILDAAGPVACRAERRGGGWVLTGRKVGVPQGATVDAVVVVADAGAGPALFHVHSAHYRTAVRSLSTMDPTRDLAEISFDSTPANALTPAERTTEILRATWRLAHTLLAAEAVGVARRALDLAVGHACNRVQFGRPIGAYQAIAHPLAEVYCDIEFARSLYRRAAWCVSTGAAEVDEAVRCAALAARDAARTATETAGQTLGALGFTWEHPLHRWYRRALWISSFDTSSRRLRADLADRLLAGQPQSR